MMIAVVPDDMPLRPHPFDQVGIFFQIIPHNKKSRRHMMLFQCVENRRRVAVFVSAVKRLNTKPFPSYSPHKTHHIAPAAPYFRPPQAVYCPPERKVPSTLLCRTRHHRLIPHAHRMPHTASEAERHAENQTQGKHRF